MTLRRLRGRPQSVITWKNILQGASIRSVFTAHCSPARILLQVASFFPGSSCPDLTRLFENHLETRVYTNSKSNGVLKHNPTIVSFLTIRIWEDASSLKHDNNGVLMCMWTYLAVFSWWNLKKKLLYFQTLTKHLKVHLWSLFFQELSTISHRFHQHQCLSWRPAWTRSPESALDKIMAAAGLAGHDKWANFHLLMRTMRFGWKLWKKWSLKVPFPWWKNDLFMPNFSRHFHVNVNFPVFSSESRATGKLV